jgi:hypothetical protein
MVRALEVGEKKRGEGMPHVKDEKKVKQLRGAFASATSRLARREPDNHHCAGRAWQHDIDVLLYRLFSAFFQAGYFAHLHTVSGICILITRRTCTNYRRMKSLCAY